MTLGEFLRQEREKRGITIEQVASATKIGVRLLHSLEGDQYGELPAKPFVRGFVTSYARFIGLNPSDVLEQFGDFIDQKAHERPARDSGHSGYAFEKREGSESTKVALWIVLGVFALFGGIAVIFLKGPKHHRGSHAEKLRAAHSPAVPPSASPSPSVTPSADVIAVVPSPAAPVPSPAPPPSPTPSPVASSSPSPEPSPLAPTPSPAATPAHSPSPSGKPDPLNSGINLRPAEIKHKIIFKALEDVRVRYQVDDRPVTSFVFKMDKILVLRATSRIVFQAKRPKALTFNYNSSGERPLENAKNLVTRQNDATLIFPAEVAETTQEPFPGQPSLSGR